MTASAPLTIGRLARAAGVGVETIRYYQRRNLLALPAPNGSAFRYYPHTFVDRIRFIKRAQELGFTLAEIRDLLSLRIDKERDRSDVRAIAEAKVADIEEKIRTLSSMKEALVRLTEHCCGHGPASECPILESLDSDEEIR